MPNNVIDSAKDEKKWKKAEEIAEDKLGHKPKSDKDWAYVMGIYKNMKPDHKFKSEKSASNVVDQWMARRVAALKTARFGILEEVLDTKGVLDAHRHLKGVDDQSAFLLVDVLYGLEETMELKPNETAALKRMQWVAKNKRGDYGMLRNNIFKAANSLGIKLPSGMFASTKMAGQRTDKTATRFPEPIGPTTLVEWAAQEAAQVLTKNWGQALRDDPGFSTDVMANDIDEVVKSLNKWKAKIQRMRCLSSLEIG